MAIPSPETSSEKITQMIRITMTLTLGESASRAITFYADPQIAMKAPDRYERTLENILGEGAKLLIKTVTETLYHEAGMEPVAGATLRDCIEAIRGNS
jgi:hypothetical protein